MRKLTSILRNHVSCTSQYRNLTLDRAGDPNSPLTARGHIHCRVTRLPEHMWEITLKFAMPSLLDSRVWLRAKEDTFPTADPPRSVCRCNIRSRRFYLLPESPHIKFVVTSSNQCYHTQSPFADYKLDSIFEFGVPANNNYQRQGYPKVILLIWYP